MKLTPFSSNDLEDFGCGEWLGKEQKEDEW
jgi:hypothetical protein